MIKRSMTQTVLLCVLAFVSSGFAADLRISDIQGTGETSPHRGSIITTRGNIVTAVIDNGFFMQSDPSNEDGNPATSEGIFVYTGDAPSVLAGDKVDVTAKVDEYRGLTELKDATVDKVSSSNTLPDPAEPALDDFSKTVETVHGLEKYESMLISVTTGKTTSITDSYGNFWFTAYSDLPFREKGIRGSAPEGIPIWDGNPELVEMDPDAFGDFESDIYRQMDILSAEGVLAYYTYDDLGRYRLLASELVLGEIPAIPTVRERRDGEVIIATQNLYNLYDSNDNYSTKLKKLDLQFRESMQCPDIIAVQEAGGIAELNDLADLIHTGRPDVTYTCYLGNGTGGIDSGFLIRDTVSVNNVYQIQENETFEFDGTVRDVHDRPPFIVDCTMTVNFKQINLIVINLHLRSMLDIEQDEWKRVKRFYQADLIAAYIRDLLMSDPDQHIVVTGDFNAFQFTDGYVDMLGIVSGNLDPDGAMIEGTDYLEDNLRNMIYTLDPGERYSYEHFGNAQAIDHMLVSKAFGDKDVEIQYVRGNNDTPYNFTYDETTPYRCSDHDGCVLFVSGRELSEYSYFLPSTESFQSDLNDSGVQLTQWIVNSSGEQKAINVDYVDDAYTVLSSDVLNIAPYGKSLLNEPASVHASAVHGDSDLQMMTLVETSTAKMSAWHPQPASSSVYIPHFDENIDYWTTYSCFSNTFGDSVSLTVTDIETALPVKPFSAENLNDNIPESIERTDSWGQVTCSQPESLISGFEMFIKNGNDGAATSLLGEGSDTLYIPHIPTQTGFFWTGFAFLNPHETSVTADVVFYTDLGDVCGESTFTIEPGEKVVDVIDNLFPEVAGIACWGVLTASDTILGIELYGTYNAGICGFSLYGNTMNDGVFPYMVNVAGEYASIALCNTDIEEARVFIQLVGSDGTVKQEKEAIVNPKSRFATALFDYFDAELLENSDFVRFSSEKKLIGVQVCGSLDWSYMTALSAMPALR